MIAGTIRSLMINFDAGIKFSAMLLMLLAVAPHRLNKGRMLLAALTCLVAFTLTNYMFERIEPSIGFMSFYAYVALNLIFAMLFVRICLKGKQILLFVLSLFFLNYILFITQFVHAAIAVITDIPFSGLIRGYALSSTADTVVRLIMHCLLVILGLMFSWFVKKVDINLSGFYWCTMIMVPLMILAIILTLRGLLQMDRQPVMYCSYLALLLGLNTLILLIFTRLVQEMEEQTKLRLTNQKLNFQIRNTEQIYQLTEETRKLRHEIKNKFFTIESMVSLGRHQDLEKYIKSELGSHEGMEPIHTGHHIIDMVLSQKIEEARRKGIPVTADIVLSNYPDIDDDMLCSLLCNLWDNAIEASEGMENPDIQVQMNDIKSYVAFELRNRVKEPVLEQNPELSTVKHDKDSHGFGVKIVRDIVKRFGGEIRFYDQNEHFVVRVMIPAATK